MTYSDKQKSILKKLNAHYAQTRAIPLSDLFSQDRHRFDRYSVEVDGLFLDYSKNKFNDETLELLVELLELSDFADWRERLFCGDEINLSEKQAALHTILRRPYHLALDSSKNFTAEIAAVRQQMGAICAEISPTGGARTDGQTISDVVCLGIGGSHLAPAMACRALKSYKQTPVQVHFISTAGCGELERLLSELDPRHTFFIVISKKFKTKETLMNAHYAQAWLGSAAQERMIAVTANHSVAMEFGITPEHCLAIPHSVGGRYSLCSAAGLPLAVDLGMEVFEQLLDGAYRMDQHFQTAKTKNNMPVILALLSVWYNNFYGSQSHAILCYDTRLELFPNYLQQVEMESNGKYVDRYGNKLDCSSAAVIWGGNALDGQHAYYQLLHQGSWLIPLDFIVTADTGGVADKTGSNAWPPANCFAQSCALMQGQQDTISERTRPGDRPSNTIMLRKITPQTLGSLIALYEHKVFCEGLIWGINSFDQWGVEQGKQLADNFFDYLQNNQDLNVSNEDDVITSLDSSTRGLISKYKAWCQ